MKTIVIGCDDAAVTLKDTIAEYVRSLGCTVEDMGVDSGDDGTYYPQIAKRVCESIIDSGYEKNGILLCGTGIGMTMSANKFKGIRAAVCHDIYSAERAKLSNNANVMCLGARVVGSELAKRLVQCFLSLEFQDGSSTPKVRAIGELEEENFSGAHC